MRNILILRFLGTIACLFFLTENTLAAERVTYMVLPGTTEPIMIVRDGDAMAGGIMTEIVKEIFQDSDYSVEPLVLPWQRMIPEFSQRNDWIIHGFSDSFDSNIPREMSELPIFPFNHVAVTLRESNLSIQSYEDLNGRTLILIENFQYPGLDLFLASVTAGDNKNTVRVVRAFTPSGALEMLRHGRGDVVIGWQARMIYNLETAGLDLTDIEFSDAVNIVPAGNAHLIFSQRQSDRFRDFVNQRIGSLTQSGRLSEIAETYYRPMEPPAL